MEQYVEALGNVENVQRDNDDDKLGNDDDEEIEEENKVSNEIAVANDGREGRKLLGK